VKITATRSEVKDLLQWCHSRNHLRIEGLGRVNAAMLEAYGEFPTGQGMAVISAFWNEEVTFEATQEEVDLMYKACLENPMMEDARYQKRPMEILKLHGGKMPGRGPR
jgi:hypothetical protein